MHRIILLGVGGYALVNAVYILGATEHWYNSVPGVSATGPLNRHLAWDVGLVFLTSGLALIWAGLRSDVTAAVLGAAWLVLHALFHLWIWMHRGFPADLMALTNLLGIQLPAALAVVAAHRLREDLR